MDSMTNLTQPAVSPISLEQATDLSAGLPELLISLLERRYLEGFRPEDWRLALHEDDSVRPLLQEIRSMARERPGTDAAPAMPQVLTATHDQGHAVVMVLHGTGPRHRVFHGGRRVLNGKYGSTTDFIDTQAGALRAHIPGLVLGDPVRSDEPDLADLADFLHSAPVAAVVTGVPSMRGGRIASSQSIDRLVAAAGRRRYALVVVAEPLPPTVLDSTIDRCRRLRSATHSLVSKTVSRTRIMSQTDSTATPDRHGALEMYLPLALGAAAGFAAAAGVATPGIMAAIMMGSRSALLTPPRSTHSTSTTNGASDGETRNLLDASAEACEVLLQRHLARLESARSGGWWRTSVFLLAEDDATAAAVSGALRAIARGDATALDPIRVVPAAAQLVRAAAIRGLSIGMHPASRDLGHPMGESFDALATCMTSDELAILVEPPRAEIPGIPRPEIGEFALTAPEPYGRSIRLGVLGDGSPAPLGPVSLSAEALNRHTLIAGMTGYGKTTTCQRILIESYERLHVPFLVIEPVKGEYRDLAAHPSLRGTLKSYTIGSDGGYPLRLNPFQPQPGIPLLRHIDLLKAVFNASFPMFAGMSYILEEAILAIYTDRGWNLHTSVNELAGGRSSAVDDFALLPTLSDLYHKIEEVLSDKQYGREVQQNLGAALRSRLRSLMVGHKGMTLDTRISVPTDQLFEAPCVVELRNLGDDEEKAFVMALLLVRLYEYAEARQSAARPAGSDRLQHLTLIEEAHRLLSAPRPGGSAAADPQAKAVTMFTDMLAEMRSYGEGFIVADQIPTKLAPEIVKNSNVKIMHRLVAPDDRHVIANALNLTAEQSRHLAGLPPGQAIVHADSFAGAVLTHIEQSHVHHAGDVPAAGPADLRYLHKNAGCLHCPAPCTLLQESRRIQDEATTDACLGDLFDAVVTGDLVAALSSWAAWCATRPERDAAAYCAAGQAAHRWAGRLCAARTGVFGSAQDTNDLLAVERIAAQLAYLCSQWSESLSEDPGKAFQHTHIRVRQLLSDPPSPALPGCADCPARCTMLGFAARVAPAARTTLTQRAAMPGLSIDARIRRVIDPADGPIADQLARFSDDSDRRALLYCTLTISASEGVSSVVDLLARLRE